MRFLCRILLFSFIALSCSKVGPGSIEGTLLEGGTNHPLKGLTVKVTRSHHYNSEELLATTTSDDNGHFKIKFYKKAFGYQSILRVEADAEHLEYSEEIDRRKTTRKIYISPIAYVKFRLQNQKADDLEILFSDMKGHSFGGIMKAYTDSLFSNIFAIDGSGSGITPIRWSYTNLSTNVNSGFLYLDIGVFGKGDTAIYVLTIE